MTESKIEVDAKLEYFIELPFNLSLPTGLYSLNIPNQIKIRRDIYYLQKGNELENPSTMEKRFLSQDQLFNEDGLVDKSYSEYSYKRKMKTVLYVHYKIPFFLRISKEEFRSKIINRELRYRDISIPEKILRFYYNKFKNQVNVFLKYYSNFYPINNSKQITQHEIRPLSNYELSKCESGINLILEDFGVQLPPIIEDSGNYFGIPESTFVNIQKTNELEKLILDRKNIPIQPYQEFFNLARGFFRTNKNTLLPNIILNTMTSFEAILHTLEMNDPKFHHFKKIKNKKILSFYFNSFRKKLKHRKVTQKAQRRLSSILREKLPEIKQFRKSRTIIQYLNFGRLIRNEIIHKGILKYIEKKNRIRFAFIMGNKGIERRIGIKLDIWWDYIMNAYNAFNLHILKLKYPSINWDHPSIYKKTHLATSTQKSEGKTVLVIPNYDWREIYSHNMDLPSFTVPPEKFPIGIITKDNKLVNLNIDYSRGKYELVSQKYINGDHFYADWMTFKFDFTFDEFERQFKNKTLNIVINRKDQLYLFRSCENCEFIIPVHRHIQYNNNECPKCRYKFELAKYHKEAWIALFNDALRKEEYEFALKYGKIALDHDQNNPNLWDNIGFTFLKLNKIDQAILCFNKSCKIDESLPNPYYNLSCAYSLKKDTESAINYLQKAIEINPEFKIIALKDSDFNNIRDSTQFKNLLK